MNQKYIYIFAGKNQEKTMKKIVLTLSIIIGIITLSKAQDNAIGVRLGYGAEFSFQKNRLVGTERIEFDLGFAFERGLNGAVIYQWTWDLSHCICDGFQWYLGAGGAFRYWHEEKENDYFNIGGVLQVGIEYTFPTVPIQLSLDYRPIVYFSNKNGWYDGICAGVRYKF